MSDTWIAALIVCVLTAANAWMVSMMIMMMSSHYQAMDVEIEWVHRMVKESSKHGKCDVCKQLEEME